MKRAFCWSILFVSMAFLAACSSTPPTAEFTAEIPATPTNTPIPTNTSFPTNTPSPVPSPTETASPLPTATSEPDAPELQIVYLDEEVFIWSETDGIRQLTQTGNISNFRLSPDGQRLVYLQTIDVERTELRLVNADGSDDRLLVSAQDLEELVPHDEPIGIFTFNWHPDGEYLAFNTHIIGYGLLKNDDLHMVNIETHSLTTLLPPGQGGDFYFSPDGSRITLVTAGNYMDIPGKISLINTDGSDRHDSLITFPSVLTYSEYAFYPPMAWSPDSTFMVVAVPSPDPMAPDASITLWHISADGSEVAELFTINASFFLSGLPIFSPDLTQVAYLQQVGEPDNPWFNLHIVRLDTFEDILYYEGIVDDFSWVPNSNQFAFVSGDATIILGSLDEPPLVTNLPGNFGMVWVDAQSYLLPEMNTANQEYEVFRYFLDGERQHLFNLKSRAATFFDIRH